MGIAINPSLKSEITKFFNIIFYEIFGFGRDWDLRILITFVEAYQTIAIPNYWGAKKLSILNQFLLSGLLNKELETHEGPGS